MPSTRYRQEALSNYNKIMCVLFCTYLDVLRIQVESPYISQLFSCTDKITGKVKASKMHFGSGFQILFSSWLAGFVALVAGEPESKGWRAEALTSWSSESPEEGHS